jgi:hypothetical protein
VADRKYLAVHGPVNFYSVYRFHDCHFKIYGAMFLGQLEPALQAADEVRWEPGGAPSLGQCVLLWAGRRGAGVSGGFPARTMIPQLSSSPNGGHPALPLLLPYPPHTVDCHPA